MASEFKKLFLEESGQGLLEYSLILFFIAVAVIFALQTVGESVTGLYNSVLEEWPL